MKSINQQLENEVFELIGNTFAVNPSSSINALEAACLILDHKFGNDFHKKNPKLAIRYAESILKNMRMNDHKTALQNGVGEYLESIRAAIQNQYSKAKETVYEDYTDTFRF